MYSILGLKKYGARVYPRIGDKHTHVNIQDKQNLIVINPTYRQFTNNFKPTTPVFVRDEENWLKYCSTSIG